MERKVTKLEHCHVEVLVTVEEKAWKAAQDKSFKKLAANVKVDGFRPGKAPESIARKHVDPMKVMDDAINALLPELYSDILANEKIQPIARPKVDVTKVSDKELEVKFVLVTAPEVKLGQYKGLEIGKTAVKVSEKEVKEAIEQTLKNSASLILKEGEAKEGDTVVMDFVGTIDGVAFDGGSAQNHELELGSHQFIPGFEEQLVGHKAGEHVEVKVTFPENYTPELKGKDAVFACDIHEVKEKKLPELNEEFIKGLNIPNVSNEEELKANKKEELKNQKEAQARREYISKVYEAIAKNSTIDLADEVVESQVEDRKQDLVNRMKQSGLDLETYLQIIGQKEEEFLAQLRKDSRRDITNFFIGEEIAKAEKIVIDDKALEEEYKKISEQYKMPIEDVKKALAPQAGEFKNNLKMQKIEDLLFNENK